MHGPDTTINFSILTPQIDLYSVNGDTICAGTSTSFSLQTSNTDSSYIYRGVIGSDIFYEGDTSQLYPVGWQSYSVEVDTGDGFVSCFSNQYIQIVENNLSIDSVNIVDEILRNFFRKYRGVCFF